MRRDLLFAVAIALLCVSAAVALVLRQTRSGEPNNATSHDVSRRPTEAPYGYGLEARRLSWNNSAASPSTPSLSSKGLPGVARDASGAVASETSRRLLSAGDSKAPPGGETSGGLMSGSKERSSFLSGRLQGHALTQALVEALEAEDLGPLEGLLISQLTEKGTQFSAEDLPLLFDALLGADDFGLQQLALTHLERLGADGQSEGLVDGYLEYLESARRPFHSKEVLSRLANTGGDQTLNGLTDLMGRSTDEHLRQRVAAALGEMRDPRAVPAIRDALSRTSDAHGESSYLRALAQLGGREAVSSIVEYAARRGNEAALKAIREITDANAAPILSSELRRRTPEPYVKAALRKLAELADPRSLPDFKRFLNDSPEAPMLVSALHALGRFRHPQAATLLEDFALRQADPKLAALAQANARRVNRMLEREAEVRSQKATKKEGRNKERRRREGTKRNK